MRLSRALAFALFFALALSGCIENMGDLKETLGVKPPPANACSRSGTVSRRNAAQPSAACSASASSWAVAARCITTPIAASASAAPAASGGAFQTAAALEEKGDGKGAVKAYITAARGGNCEAAKRLGDIFDKGLIGVSRDYAESLRWYNFARTLGTCEVPIAKSRS